MKRVLLLFALIASVFLAGCQMGYTVRGVSVNQDNEDSDQFGVKGHTAMEKMAKMVRPDVWACVKSININGDESHYSADHAAHCHRAKDGWRNGDICVKPQYVTDIVFLHEIHHASHFSSISAGDTKFCEEWQLVAGDVYGDDKVQPGQTFPYQGLLRDYSAKSYLEDAADTFMYVHAEVFGHDTPYDQFRTKGLVKPDLRYKKKVELLWKYDRLTDEVYHKFTALDLFRN